MLEHDLNLKLSNFVHPNSINPSYQYKDAVQSEFVTCCSIFFYFLVEKSNFELGRMLKLSKFFSFDTDKKNLLILLLE